MSSLVAADFFAGAGGLSHGFQRAGFQIAFANEINPDYATTYECNHPGTRMFRGSIEHLNTKELLRETGHGRHDIDVLIGGPPCQGFSINAPLRNFADQRNRLFQEYPRSMRRTFTFM